MAGSLKKYSIGKEDMSVQTNTDATETFDRLGSMGGTQTLEKIPDIWDSTGKIRVAQCQTSATDPGDITETIAAQDLTHDVLKTKINEILAALRVAGFFT
jgi:hypothetical protein